MSMEEPEGPSRNGRDGVFPTSEKYRDCTGTNRVFEIVAHKAATGWVVMATEVGYESSGYEFRAF